MDLGIKELGVTFLVGSFAILGLEFVLHRLLGKSLTGFFSGKLGLRDTAAWLFVATGFAVGIVAEDISYKFVDTEPLPFYDTAELIVRLVPMTSSMKEALGLIQILRSAKADLRLAAVVEPVLPSAGCEASGVAWQPTHLGREIGRLGLTAEFTTRSWSADSETRFKALEQARKVDAWLSEASPPTQEPPSCQWTNSAVSAAEFAPLIGVFYVAKNTAYRKPTHYDELKRLQTRLEFSRSIAVLAYVYCVVALLTVPVAIVQIIASTARVATRIARYRRPLYRALLAAGYVVSGLVLRYGGFCLYLTATVALLVISLVATWQRTAAPSAPRSTRHPRWPRKSPPSTDVHGRVTTLAFSLLEVTVVLLAIHFFGLWAYTREATEYSKRAMGYYATSSLQARLGGSDGAD